MSSTTFRIAVPEPTMDAQTPTRSMFCTNPDPRSATSNKNDHSNTPYPPILTRHHIAELSALPRSPEDPLTPPDSNPFKPRYDPLSQHPTTPSTSSFNTQDPKSQLIAEQQFQISVLTSQRAIDRKSIARLEDEREQREDYDHQRDQHRLYITRQWADGIEEITRLERGMEEFKDVQSSRFEALHQRSKELLFEVGRLEGTIQERAGREEKLQVRAAEIGTFMERVQVENERLTDLVVESSRKERESELSSLETVEVARAALVERGEADERNAELRLTVVELELTVTRLRDDGRRFWGSLGSSLAVLVMLVVLVESC